MTELTSIDDILRWGAAQFEATALHYGHGTDNSWDEALSLVLFALKIADKDANATLLDKPLNKAEKQQILQLFQSRIEQRIPAAYLTHRAYFAGLEFYVDQRVLIPRSPIAELIEEQFSPWVAADRVQRVLDLCTGGGCIAIALAYAFSQVEVDASDISLDALAVAKKNCQRHNLTSRVHLLQSDLFAQIPRQSYDIIVSNPPYVSASELASLPPEYQHEPQSGFAAGNDGLACIVPILEQAADYLADDGILLVEVGNSEPALAERFPEVPFLWLEFARGGQGVFLLTAQQVQQHFPKKV